MTAIFDAMATPAVIVATAAICYLVGREDGRDAEAAELLGVEDD